MEIWKSKMAAASDVIMLLRLPLKPIKHQVVSINWKYKQRSNLYAQKSSQSDGRC